MTLRRTLENLLFVSTLLVLTTVAQAQPPATAEAAPTDEPVESLEGEAAEEEESPGGIEEILLDDEAVLAGESNNYDPGDRRDPFLSPMRRQVNLPKGPRPEGKPGLLIEELALSGIFDTPEGRFAQVRGGPKDKSYLIQVGDQLYDGDVVDITETEVIFTQMVNDPAATKPFREVTKKIQEKKK